MNYDASSRRYRGFGQSRGPYTVAAALNVPRTRIERIAREEKPVTADTALRLGKFFKTGAETPRGPARSRGAYRH
jgi:hypothetical protein